MFGLLFLYYVAMGILGQILTFGLLSVLGPGALWMAGMFVWTALRLALFSMIVVVTYHALRVAREGIDSERLADVFS